MKFKKIIIYLLSIFFLYSCTGVTDALKGTKRSENSDEFLVQKKNPLTVPPDVTELPVPLDQDSEENKDQAVDIKKVLKIDETKVSLEDTKNGDQKNLEESILEKINN
tara:strand:- start:346 stop:669 length:324 start_codon:yes stop_codon:yes gene_type:complete